MTIKNIKSEESYLTQTDKRNIKAAYEWAKENKVKFHANGEGACIIQAGKKGYMSNIVFFNNNTGKMQSKSTCYWFDFSFEVVV